MFKRELNLLKKEYKYFCKSLDRFLINHRNKYVLIKGNKIYGFFETIEKAFNKAKENNFKLGYFMVKQIIPKEEAIIYK